MKFLLQRGLLAAAVLLAGFMASHINATGRHKQDAQVNFREPVLLQNVTLQGDYLFIHDDDRMAKGEPCMHVYQGSVPRADKLVTSFRCQPVERKKADRDIVASSRDSSGQHRVTEIQFAGTSEGHRIP